jgi:hypothetical protein
VVIIRSVGWLLFVGLRLAIRILETVMKACNGIVFGRTDNFSISQTMLVCQINKSSATTSTSKFKG